MTYWTISKNHDDLLKLIEEYMDLLVTQKKMNETGFYWEIFLRNRERMSRTGIF